MCNGLLVLCFPPGCFLKIQPLLGGQTSLLLLWQSSKTTLSSRLENVVTQLQGGQE